VRLVRPILLLVYLPVFVALAAPGSLTGVQAAAAAPRGSTFRVSSPAFRDGGLLPDGFTCDGAGASPPISWRRVPAGTEELALVVDDPDAPAGTFVHWVAWGIDPASGRIPEQLVPAGIREGRAGTGRVEYVPPCPPGGDGTHGYRFTLYALSRAPDVAEGATERQLRRAIRGSVLARSRIVARYER
jgi:hypothetical protein